ncbi:MAG: hypothetical protein P8Z30_13360 [Acidobacteriota bacterium]
MKMQQHHEGKSPSRRRVEVHIEELVLHGFAPGDRHRIAVAVKQELSRLILAEGVPASARNPSARARLGRAVYHGLSVQAGTPGTVSPSLPGTGDRTR